MLDFWNYFQKNILEGNPPWNNFIKVGGMYRSSVKIVPGTKQNNTPIRAYARIHSYSTSICGHLRVLPKLVHTRKYHYTTIYMCTSWSSCKHPSNYVSRSDWRGSSTKTSKDWCESRWPSAKEYNMSPQNMRENRKPRIMRSFLWIWHWSHSSNGWAQFCRDFPGLR